jgi:hypothetical protein
LTPHRLYSTGKPKHPFETHVMHNTWWASCLDLFCQTSYATPRSLWVGTELAHQQRQSTRCDKVAGVASHHDHDFEKNVWPPFLDEVTPISQRVDFLLAFFLLFVHFLYRL